MNYPYTATNRLQEPHAYMYSPYGGVDFLHGYVEDRLERLRALGASSDLPCGAEEARLHAVLHGLLAGQGDFPPSGIDLPFGTPEVTQCRSDAPRHLFSLEEPVETTALLEMLLYRLLNSAGGGEGMAEASLWLDRLLQRFEVSKKLFAEYLPGFRKGAGACDDVALYQRFALVLALAYAHRNGLQHLSTLLKVNDLLLSVPAEYWSGCSHHSLVLAVAVELHAVQRLARGQGVNFDAL